MGKEIAFNITHTLDAGSQKAFGTVSSLSTWSLILADIFAPKSEREFANAYIAPAGPGLPPQDVAQLIVAAGWAKVREGGGEGEEAVRRLGAEEAKRRENLRAAEASAKEEGKGLWSEYRESVSLSGAGYD